MIASRRSKLRPEPEREHESKQRRYLKYRKLFMSDCVGERIARIVRLKRTGATGEAGFLKRRRIDGRP